METHNALVVFEGKSIRRLFHNNEWFYVVVDIVSALTDTVDSSDYLKKVRLRDEDLNKGWGQIVTPLPIPTSGGVQSINCSTAKGIFRIIQSIPSPKAEPFKLWLAQVGYERVQEIENPELAQKRMKEIYKFKGYSDEWIEKRVRGIAVRNELTDEWKKRNVKLKHHSAFRFAQHGAFSLVSLARVLQHTSKCLVQMHLEFHPKVCEQWAFIRGICK